MNARKRDDFDIRFTGDLIRLPVEALCVVEAEPSRLSDLEKSRDWSEGGKRLATVIFNPDTNNASVFSNDELEQFLREIRRSSGHALSGHALELLGKAAAPVIGPKNMPPRGRSLVVSANEPIHLWLETAALPSMDPPRWWEHPGPAQRRQITAYRLKDELPEFRPPQDDFEHMPTRRLGDFDFDVSGTGNELDIRRDAEAGLESFPADTKELTTTIRRTPHMDVPEVAPALNAPFEVTVYADEMSPHAGEEAENIILEGVEGQDEYEVRAWLSCSQHFKILDESPLQSLMIRRGEPLSNKQVFHLVVSAPLDGSRPAVITALFSYHGRPCGHVSRRMGPDPVNPASGSTTGSRPVIFVEAKAKPADLTVEIRDPDNTSQSFDCTVTTPLLDAYTKGISKKWNLNGKAQDIVLGYFSQFTSAPDNPRRLASLRGAGLDLFEAAPAHFKEAFWGIIDAQKPLRTISIVSQEPFIPWELMIPSRDGTDRSALGVEFAVGRWWRSDNVSPPQAVKLVDSRVFAPQYRGQRPKPLPSAAAEAQLVEAAFPGPPITPADFAQLQAAFREGGASVLHFVCHGADPVGFDQYIYLEDGSTLSSLQVKGMAEVRECCAKAKPLVFLNACEVGRTKVALVGIGGFSRPFIEAGASCVIAPLWSVKDTIAHEVAETFYGALRNGSTQSFAEMLCPIRAKAYAANGGEDTYAAYCFYGDPLAARVVAKQAPAERDDSVSLE
jgi:hypothetical protein